MRTIALALVAVAAAAGCNKGGAGSSEHPSLQTDDQKTLYTLGLLVGRNVSTFDLTPAELELVKAGLVDAVTHAKPAVEIETWGPKVNQLANARRLARAEKEKEKSKAFLETAAKESGITKYDSGLLMKTLTPGTGDSPKQTDRVKVNYEGKLTDGTVFDSSIKRGQPAEFGLVGVVPCWTEGVQKMKVGEKAKLVCPPNLAYGDRGMPPAIPGGAALVFEIELLEIMKAPPQPAMPSMSLPPPSLGIQKPGHVDAAKTPAPAKKP